MKTIKRIAALVLVAAMVLSLAACHKKNEIAVTVGDVEFTSAYYMCALIGADSEAKSLVYEGLSDEEKNGYEAPDYYSKKVEDKDYVTWVEEKAMSELEKIAAYKTLSKENKLEVDKDTLSQTESYVEYYWSSYGYSAYYEPNGVSYETYKNYMMDSNYAELYFEHVYGEEGTKPVSKEDIKNKIYEKFIIANVLEATYEQNATDDQKSALKTKINDYAAAIKEGKMTFEQAYNDYNNIKPEDTKEEEHDHDHEHEDATSSVADTSSNEETSSEATTSDATSSETKEEEKKEEPTPKDKYASILGAEGAEGYESDYYDDVKDLAVGEVKVIELENSAGLALVVKQDIKADEYYLTALDMTVRHMLKDDEFDKDIAEYIKKMEKNVSKYAIGQFKLKNIIEPSYQ